MLDIHHMQECNKLRRTLTTVGLFEGLSVGLLPIDEKQFNHIRVC
jgi:hypothetical protein